MIGIRANDGTLVNADFIQEYRVSPQLNGEKYQLEAIFGRKADNELDSTPLVIGTQQECLLELDYLSDRKAFPSQDVLGSFLILLIRDSDKCAFAFLFS